MTDKIKIEVTKKQLELISFMADKMSRLLMGHLEYAMEDILTGNLLKLKYNNKIDENYWNERDNILQRLKELRTNCFQLEPNEFLGVGFDDNADVLSDINQVIRHFLYLENGETSKIMVDAYPALHHGSEPLIKILEGNE